MSNGLSVFSGAHGAVASWARAQQPILTHAFLIALFCFALTGCVGSSSNSSQGVSTVLALTDSEKSSGKPAKPNATTEKTSDASATKTALKSSDKKQAPAVKAVENVGKTASAKKTQSGFFKRNDPNELRRQVAKKRSLERSRALAQSRKARPRKSRSTKRSNNAALPGVRSNNKLFGIFGSGRKNKDLDEPLEVASVTNLARRGNFGLLLQTSSVKVGCFPRSLVRILKRVERRFGRTPIVTSGYRSRSKNRRVRGARNSSHISCKAADIQVRGVSKWQLAKYLRSVPGRGGVGTYCHTKSVHIDIGKKRDWNWRCRRRRR